jgi:hypothetical protein
MIVGYCCVIPKGNQVSPLFARALKEGNLRKRGNVAILPPALNHPMVIRMIIIRFPEKAAKKRALGYLAGRFSFKSWSTGEMMVPEEALSALAAEGISFFVEGPASYDRFAPLRNSDSVAI